MNAPIIRVNSRGDLVEAIALHEQVGARHRIPLLRALLNGQIAFYECQRSTSARTAKRFFAMVEKPAILLIGADDYAAKAGPAGWPVADRAMRWARCVIVHGTGGTAEQYAEFVDAAQVVRRLLVIETTGDAAAEWIAMAKATRPRPAIRALLPLPGAAHPVLPAVRQ